MTTPCEGMSNSEWERVGGLRCWKDKERNGAESYFLAEVCGASRVSGRRSLREARWSNQSVKIKFFAEMQDDWDKEG